MRFSVMTEPHLGGTYDQQLEVALWAEDAGLVSFARCDHYLAKRDPVPEATDAFAVLAGLARDTEQIRLCVLVSPITFRHPAVLAKNAATIDQMSGGRLDLGVGTGWMTHEHEALGIPFPDSGERWDRFEEALEYLDAAFTGSPGRHDGRYYHLDAVVEPKPKDLRLVVGGSGPRRTPTLAGKLADEYNFFLCPPGEAKSKVEVMRAAAGDRHVEATVMGPACVGRDDVDYRTKLQVEADKRAVSPAQLEQRWTDNGTLFGAPSQVAESVAALEEAGVDRIYVQWLDLGDIEGLKAAFEVVLG